MKYPKILVGCPTYEGKDYCLDKWVENVKKIKYPNFQWCIVDNSKTKRYSNKLKRKYPGHIYHVERGENSRDGIARSSNFLRQKVLKENYDYLLMVEIDLFPPKDVIWRLLRHARPVTGLPYEIGWGLDQSLCIFIPEMQKNGLLKTRRLTKEENKTFLDGTLKRVHGMGVGCVLIHKNIVKEFPFFYSKLDDKRMKEKHTKRHPDVYFYLDLHNNKIPVFCDTSFLVEHDKSNWLDVEDI